MFKSNHYYKDKRPVSEYPMTISSSCSLHIVNVDTKCCILMARKFTFIIL